ncbi:C-terminal binding protein [Roseisalinus antarcticus]|uniref:Glycerate dehydrogenase n=1 Tax=Roseisalinus antarcticus TaxID=254357 RepID=A0A1Y5THS6_9RHOB|nr:C-terminal binding protein [Roseisalinus antarcticus]SLN64449.1 Glycerate dehydrogenase [Roseisalinus antarcticus]
MADARIVVTDYTFPSLDREEAAAGGAEFVACQCKSEQDVIAALKDATLAVVQFAPVTAAAIDGMAEGAALIRYGIGYDNIDVAAANARGFSVGYVPDYCPDEVADHTAAMLLAQLRKLPALDASVRAGDWKAVGVAKPMKPFAETLVGFFGFGQIGRGVHARLKSFGFRFAVADPALSADEAETLGIRLMDGEELFRQADAISLHAPATDATRNFVNAERLATMQPGAVIVNTSRGALIDEAALARALQDGQIAGAALDVFADEPLSDDSPLRNAPGLLLTPHAAWYSEAAIGRLQELVAQDIANHLAGRALRKPVPGSTA